MQFLGFKVLKTEVNQVQKHLGMKESDAPVWWIYFGVLTLVVISALLGLKILIQEAFPRPDASEPYTDTIYQNSGFTELSYLDIDGRAWLVPLHYETLMKAKEFGEAKGEENTIYMGRVVVTALDPSMRYVELPSGITGGTAYKPENIYTFYLPDGKDITDDKAREHTIRIGNKSYKVTLLYIDGRDVKEGDTEKLSKYAYTFRVEEVVR